MNVKKKLNVCVLATLMSATTITSAAVEVNPTNFVRAETDLYMATQSKSDAFGKLFHTRELAPIDGQKIVRLNRDTLYSVGVFDLDAGPVTIQLPDAGKRFMSVQVISQDHYTPEVIYDNKPHTFTKENVGTRYVMFGFRTFVNPLDPKDVKAAQKLQDQIKFSQPGGPGKFEIPEWDMVSQNKVRDALLVLNETLPNTNGMFGKKGEVNPILHLIGSASGWGGNPESEATYLNVTPSKNDGKTVYKMNVKDVPVNGFWSISVYNEKGYYEPNELNRYTLNNLTAQKSKDGSIDIQFGNCEQKSVNCLPIVKGWNYMVRLYRPDASILDGTWKFPEAQPVE